MWATRQTEEIDKDKEPEFYVKITLRELGTFAGFLVIICFSNKKY